MVKKKPAAQAKTAENETVKVETKAAEKTTAAEKEAVKEAVKAGVLEILKRRCKRSRKGNCSSRGSTCKSRRKTGSKSCKNNPHNSKENNDKESGCTEKTSSSEKAGREKSTCKSSKERSGAGDDSAVRRKRNQGERSVRENPADLDRRIWQESRGIKEPEGLCKTGGIYCLLRNQ